MAHVRVGNIEQALQYLFLAFDAGWCDAEWLERDPELMTLKTRMEFRDLVQQIQSSTVLPQVPDTATENELAEQPAAGSV